MLRSVGLAMVGALLSCFAGASASAATVKPQGAFVASGSTLPKGSGQFEAEEIEPYSKNPTEERPYALCPPPTRQRASCMAAVVPYENGRPVVAPGLEGSGVKGGFSPSDLRSAYDLPATGGEGQTVAVTIAYDHPDAESDLATYRSRYGLPPCTTANGCFRKVNQRGEAGGYPVSNAEWALETSLDLDMVSATCPECDILLIEADSNDLDDLGAAVNKAAEMGADVITNSWATEEFPGETASNHYFNHPGIPNLFASGDWGYGVYYPAASPDVIAVGGTSLAKATSPRGWSESAWSGAGSGCSKYEAKPAWQRDESCPARTVADVSAVSDPQTPVSVYHSYEYSGWQLLGGTSVATPLLAGVEALSSSAFRAAGPGAFSRAGQGGGLFDVTEGENGECAVQGSGDFEDAYLCQADTGYDGPTGWGTPGGPQFLPVAITEPATVASPDKATLHGSIDPGGLPTTYRFEYGETTSYGTNIPLSDKSAGSGNGYVKLNRPIEGLQGQTPYHYRIVATNAEGTFPGVDRTFGTTKPTASTAAASDIGTTSATLHGSVSPEGLETTYYFEYGPSTSYGHKASVRAQGAGGGTGDVAVSTVADSLSGGTAYHYRLVARNAAGVTYGTDRTFFAKPAKWIAETLPQPPNSGHGHSGNGVSCLAPDDCIAVGSNWSLDLHARATLAERWHGSEWSPMDTPNPPGLQEGWEHDRYAVLSDVRCTSASNCLAIGHYKSSDEVVRPLAEHWDGSKWTIIEAPAFPAGASLAQLTNLSCTSASACTAVGYYVDASEAVQALIERWDGSGWTIQPASSPAGASATSLEGVSCSSINQCVAVGEFTNSTGVDKTLAEHWDGSKWSIEETDDPPGELAITRFDDVSCPAADICMAVGVHVVRSSGVTRRPLAQRWDGSEWSRKATPEPPSSDGAGFASVSCPSPNSCTAVGSTNVIEGTDSSPEAFGERWNGASWSILEMVGLPDPAGWWHERWLYGVSCTEPDACTAVGAGLSAPSGELSPYRALGEHEIPPPYAEFSISPTSPVPGQPVGFDASASNDPGGTIKTYKWAFGDGSSTTGRTPAHTYTAPGAYTATLTVTDDDGNAGEASYEILVDAPPVASFATSSAPTATQQVTFDASSSSDPDDGIAHYRWEFGDGSTETGQKPTHTYARAGNYPVTLVVVDESGKADEVTQPISVASAPPTASFSIATPTPTASEPVEFDASASSDPDGTIESYGWDFGDGSQSNGPSPSHSYAQSGTYEVTLVVTDDEGAKAEAAQSIEIAEALPQDSEDSGQPSLGEGSSQEATEQGSPPRTPKRSGASGAFAVRRASARCDGRIVLVLHAPGPGAFMARATFARHAKPAGRTARRAKGRGCAAKRVSHRSQSLRRLSVAPSRRRLYRKRFGYGSTRSVTRGRVRLVVKPRNALARWIRRHLYRRVRVRVAIDFTSRDGAKTTKRITVRLT